MKKNILESLLRLKQTVFSFKELLIIGETSNIQSMRSLLHYYVKQEKLYHIRKGFYGKDKDYNRFELAVKLYTPSYISFETVLFNAGIVFQVYNQIFVASYLSREIVCDNQKYKYRKLKKYLLTNIQGVETKDTYSIATPERAFLDILYLHKNYYFDNPEELNWKKIYELLPIYHNKRMKKVVDSIYEQIKKNSEKNHDN